MTRPLQTYELAGAQAIQRACLKRHLPPADADAERVLELVSARRGVPAVLLLHRSRCRAPVAHARQLAMYLMHTLLGRKMADVGRVFGRDRTTVSHACALIEDQRDDCTFDAEVLVLEEALLGSDHRTSVDRSAGHHG